MNKEFRYHRLLLHRHLKPWAVRTFAILQKSSYDFIDVHAVGPASLAFSIDVQSQMDCIGTAGSTHCK